MIICYSQPFNIWSKLFINSQSASYCRPPAVSSLRSLGPPPLASLSAVQKKQKMLQRLPRKLVKIHQSFWILNIFLSLHTRSARTFSFNFQDFLIEAKAWQLARLLAKSMQFYGLKDWEIWGQSAPCGLRNDLMHEKRRDKREREKKLRICWG